MPLYVLNRNMVFSTTKGVISFTKGQPAYVPPHMERDVVAIGGERVDGDTPSLTPKESPASSTPYGEERETQIHVAFDLLTERNDPNDFTGSGCPTVKAVEKITGFDVDRSEVGQLWQAYKLTKAGAE